MRQSLVIVFLFLSAGIYAQIAISGIPESFLSTKKSSYAIPETFMPSIDAKKLIEADSIEGIENRFAIGQYVDINLKRDGIKIEIPSKGTIWQYALSSPNAFSLGIAFTEFFLPKGASVFIYSPDHSKILGAYTELNNNEKNYLQIEELFGNEAIIEYFEPLNASFSGMLSIGNVSSAYRDIQNLMQANSYDINCPGWENLQTVKKAICRMIFKNGADSYYCSGSLLNNTAYDETPYFLTAAHCISTAQEALTLITYFNYESESCGSANIRATQTLSGAKLLSTYGSTDFTLLLLNEKPPESYSPYYLGWDVSGNVTSGSYCIHHPAGRIKSAAYASVKATSYDEIIAWDEGPNSPANSHWLINLTKGATERGSSGSALLNSSFQAIGQLHGGGETVIYYGKLSESWKSASIKKWLDPKNTGTKSLQGTAGQVIPNAGFAVYPERACTNGVISITDTSKHIPSSWLWTINTPSENYEFVDGTKNTTANPKMVFKKPGFYEINLLVTNAFGNDSTKTTYEVSDSLQVKFVDYPTNKEVCGCDLKNTTISAKGAANYSFDLSSLASIDTSSENNKLSLTVKDKALLDSSFSIGISVKGSHGTCVASDSIKLQVSIPLFDFVEKSANIKLGKNGPFSNKCASVELYEPRPNDGGCQLENNWCYDGDNTNVVINNSLWFNFNAPSNGLINIATEGFDTRIALYKANKFEDLVSNNISRYKLIAANDNTSTSELAASLKEISVEAGKKYWLQVDGFKKASGNFYITLYNNELEAFPNPSFGLVNFQIARNQNSTGTIEIYSSLGSLVYKAILDNSPDKVIQKADLRGNAAGVYIAFITLGTEQYIKKIVLLKTK